MRYFYVMNMNGEYCLLVHMHISYKPFECGRAGKVVDRHWYNKNKHIFPASRWEVYEPEKEFDSYTIYG